MVPFNDLKVTSRNPGPPILLFNLPDTFSMESRKLSASSLDGDFLHKYLLSESLSKLFGLGFDDCR